MQVLATLALASTALAGTTITQAPSPTQIEVAKRAASSPNPLTDYTYAYSAVPYQVNPYAVGRGPQSGYNQCNSTTGGPESNCQTLVANSIGDFCLWGSPTTSPNGTIGDVEAAVVSYCTNDQHGARVIPAGAITAVQVLRTKYYTQWTGRMNLTGVNLMENDTGGELDPHGADLLGNPLGGLVYSSGLPTGNNQTLEQVISWNEFIGSGEFCLKLCDPSYTDVNYCENKFDLLGCAYNMPASYEDNVFLDCDSDLQEVVGTYVGSNGATSTWSQPSSLPADSTLPWTPTIPATSNCKTYASTDIFPTSLLGYQTSASASSSSATATSIDSKASKSTAASRSGNSASAAAQSGGAGSQGSSSTTKNGAVAVGVSGVLAVASIVVTLLF